MLRIIISPSARIERRRRQSKKILEKNVKMRFCFLCIFQNFRCIVNRDFDSYVKCVKINLFCDLIITVVD